MNRCLSCFKEYDEEYEICPYCGTLRELKPREPIHLYPGTILAGRYLLGQAVGSGGFGIIYRAWDLKLETVVAVKEFYAGRLVTRAGGTTNVIVNKKSKAEFEYRKARFLAEARNMAKFGAHRSIPNVFEFFEENNTAYIVMELLSGIALNEYLADHQGKIDMDFALMIANEVGNALISLHEKGIIHRDVAPDNIFICSNKELRIKLLDLGAAKLADGDEDVVDIILKPGYSPPEQYDNTKGIGPWSDLYALGATLYVMLTGVKSDESTNRKIEDTVLPPHEINESIPENLSNAVMKAMAVEKHMRFKTVKEFLEAINGERHVLTLAKEKKRHKRNRFTGIAAACLAIVLLGTGVFHMYSGKRAEQLLEDASISIWYSVVDGSTEEAAMESVIEDFQSKFDNIEIELKAIPEGQYAGELRKAALEGRMPTLFESTEVSDAVLEQAEDLSKVLQSEQAKKCLFLNQYHDYYSDTKKVPLGIEVPMAYVITKGAAAIEFDERYFTDIADFKTEGIALDTRYSKMFAANVGARNYEAESGFLDDTSNTCPVLLASSMKMNEVDKILQGYSKSYVYYKAKEIYCGFIYEWSIGGGSKSEVAAAERLLSWMLGNAYQNTLMISKCSDGQIPVNETCFMEKIKADDLSAIKDIYKNFVFED